MRFHFIAIGGSAMHNLALALHEKGHIITGSDDEIFEPSRSRLLKKGLLPEKEGWFVEKLTSDIDAVVLGMHARADNPELLRAQEIGLKIYSYPEFLYQQTKNKTRVVVGGSHGKTTTTAMIMHVLKHHNYNFDYMVGAQLDGFETMVKITDNAEIAVFEGDEYLTSPIDLTPKFHHYKPNIAIVTGIAWDHINVFPEFDGYVEQFQIFANTIEANGSFIYFSGDEHLSKIASSRRKDISAIPYNTHPFIQRNGKSVLTGKNTEAVLDVFGEHNLQNISAAKEACIELGITEEDFFVAIASFKGAAKRLQKLVENNNVIVFQDFAHSPSKLKATVKAVRENFSEKKLVAVMELHTFSSLNKEFFEEYAGSMDLADDAIVYYSQHALEMKKLPAISKQEVKNGFKLEKLEVMNEQKELISAIEQKVKPSTVVLLMSSGNFSGINLQEFARELTEKA